MDSIVLQEGASFRFISTDSLQTHPALPADVYTINNNPLTGYYLNKTDPLQISSDKIYGSMVAKADRIMNTYIDRGRSTGVLLAGIKGAGKSLLAKLISTQALARQWPILLVNEPHFGTNFQEFLSKINTPAVVLVDEFDKVYERGEKQRGLLTLLDGTATSNKLFIFTVNNKYAVDQHLLCRPGRVYYMLEFKSLDEDIVREYLNDKLDNKDNVSEAVHICRAINELSFDMLAALVEECNRYNLRPEEAIELLNIKPEFMDECQYRGELTYQDKDGKEIVRKKDRLMINAYADWRLSFSEYDAEEGDYREFEFNPSHTVSMEHGRIVCRREDASLLLTRIHANKPMSLAYGY